jgi:hypothetical protein
MNVYSGFCVEGGMVWIVILSFWGGFKNNVDGCRVKIFFEVEKFG